MLIVAIVMLVNSLAYGVIIPLMYPFASHFGITASGMSILFASFSLAQFIATPIIGRLSDKYGRKFLLLICLFGSSISLFVFGAAQSVTTLFIARILDGVTGGNLSVAQAIIADSSTEKDRAKAFGILGAIFGFGFIFGPAIGGFLSKYSLSTPFYFAGTLAMVGTILGVFLLQETNKHKQEHITLNKLFDPKGLVRALFQPITGPVFVVSLLSLISLNAFIIGFQAFTVDKLKLDTIHIGLLFTQFGIVSVIMQGFGIKLLQKWIPSHRKMVRLSLTLAALAMFLTAFAQSYLFFAISLIIFAIVNSPTGPVTTALLSEHTKAEDQGGVLGINQAYMSISQIVGPLLAGAIVGYSPNLVFVFAGIVLLLSLPSALHIRPANEKLDL